MKPRIIVICGPTATGKTGLAIDLAKKFNGELVSADSRQVYLSMDIITGKDTVRSTNTKSPIPNTQINSVPVWMTDVCNPDYRFNVSEYVELANKAIKDIESRGKLPIVVGGTGLYLRGLFGNIETLGIPPNNKLRKELDRLTVSELQNKLSKLASPLGGLVQLDKSKLKSLNQSDRNNPRRLIRAIEVATWFSRHSDLVQNQKATPCHSGAVPLRSFQRRTESQNLYKFNTLWIGLSADFSTLYKRIDQRVDDRIVNGAENEVRDLLKAGYNWDNSVMGVTLGYRQWRDFIEGKASREDVIQEWKFAEHAYARRQLTWFKKEKAINWFDISKPDWQKTVLNKVDDWFTEKQVRLTR